jgi:hypothetical protein
MIEMTAQVVAAPTWPLPHTTSNWPCCEERVCDVFVLVSDCDAGRFEVVMLGAIQPGFCLHQATTTSETPSELSHRRMPYAPCAVANTACRGQIDTKMALHKNGFHPSTATALQKNGSSQNGNHTQTIRLPCRKLRTPVSRATFMRDL